MKLLLVVLAALTLTGCAGFDTGPGVYTDSVYRSERDASPTKHEALRSPRQSSMAEWWRWVAFTCHRSDAGTKKPRTMPGLLS
jgi:hypothetical protein